VAVLTSSDIGPLTATYASVAGAMLLCSVWLTMALIGLEEQPHRSIVVGAGSHLRVLLATAGTAAVWCLLLTAAGPWATLCGDDYRDGIAPHTDW
jgi:hypothetical protein